MKGVLIIPVLAFMLLEASCSGPQQKNNNATDSLVNTRLEKYSSSLPQKARYNFTDPVFDLSAHKHKFHTERIQKFDDTFFAERKDDSLYPIIARESFDLFQSNEKVIDHIVEWTPYYYAVQRADSHTGIIIKQTSEGWIDEYIYMAYNPQGKLVGSVVLAGMGGDGGYVTTMTGEFVNDSVFMKKTIETEYDFEREVANVIVNTIDEIIIHWNGLIETRTIK
jgi:hypothetical protein